MALSISLMVRLRRLVFMIAIMCGGMPSKVLGWYRFLFFMLLPWCAIGPVAEPMADNAFDDDLDDDQG